MPVIDQTVVIARPAAELLDLLARAENLARWDSSIVECVQLDAAPVTVGDRARLRYRLDADSDLGGAFGRATEPVIEKAHANVVKANLATLVRPLEPQAA